MVTKDDWMKLKPEQKLDHLMEALLKLVDASKNANRIGDNIDRSLVDISKMLKTISETVTALEERAKKADDR